MDRIRNLFKAKQSYEPIHEYQDNPDISSEDGVEDAFDSEEKAFSQLEYWIFLLMGVAMLWAWNMFLAAAPYFQHRFSSHQWILTHFQSAEISVSTITNLVSMLALTKLQKNASYPHRIASSLCINIICFTLLAISTLVTTSPPIYFAFLMLMVFSASLATGLIQNGLFAYVSGFGRSEYTQAIMTGQAVAGVLPCLAEIATVLAVPEPSEQPPNQAAAPSESPTSAFTYFLTATAVSVVALFAFLHLTRRQQRSSSSSTSPSLLPKPTSTNTTSSTSPSIPLTTLFLHLPTLSTTIFLTFALTMTFPVFTTRILSLHPHLLPAPLFIPLAFLVWNTGDLLGRLSTLYPALRASHRLLLLLALARSLFIPLYLLCNIGGAGALVNSDLFYLAVVQLLFGVSNGYLGSSCMMAAGEAVGVREREAAGGFMGLCLVAGLTVGSLLSFMVAGV